MYIQCLTMITESLARQRWRQWPKKRDEVLDRDGRTCQECGVPVTPRTAPGPTAEVHHLIPVRSGGSDDPSNLTTLCGACHGDVHAYWGSTYPTIGIGDYRVPLTDGTWVMSTPEDDNRPHQARNAEQFSDDEFLAAVESDDMDSTSEVAEIVGCSLQTALRRLQRLEDRGELESRQISGPYVWRRA